MLDRILKYLQLGGTRAMTTSGGKKPVSPTLEMPDSYHCEHHEQARQQYELDATAEAFGIVRHHKEHA